MKKFILMLLICCVSGQVSANIGPQGFKAYPNYYFVETGTYTGEGIARAMRDNCFKEYRSLEYDGGLFNRAQKRFSGDARVKLKQGDSSKDLWYLIADIDQEITFWLDAHVYPPRKDGGKNCPLVEELEQISRHPIKTHTILIDDMHCAETAAFDGLTKEDIIHEIMKINPLYKITYIPGGNDGEYPQNVMVATVTK